jgi:hypothetical protein
MLQVRWRNPTPLVLHLGVRRGGRRFWREAKREKQEYSQRPKEEQTVIYCVNKLLLLSGRLCIFASGEFDRWVDRDGARFSRLAPLQILASIDRS